MTRRTFASALGAGTLVLAALAAGVPSAVAAGPGASGRHAERVCAATSAKATASCLSKVMVDANGGYG